MQKLSATLSRLSESATIEMSRRSRELAEQGIDVISLSLGEPDFDTPDFIKEAANKAIAENFTHYPPVNGFKDLREAIAEKFQRDNNLSYTADEIVVSTGAKQSIANVVLSLVDPGDEVLLPAPFWVTYAEIVKMAGATPVVIESTVEQDFKVSAEQIQSAIGEKTRMIIFSSPCNPSGSVYEQAELEAIANVLANRNIFVISDEIYEQINFTEKHESIGQFAQIHDQLITVNGVSKAFSMTGWRIGYIGAPLWIAKACTTIQGQITSGACTISQKAAKAAVLADPKAVVQPMRNAFLRRRDFVLEKIRQISGLKTHIPMGAFYVFPDVSSYFGAAYGSKKVENAVDLCNYLLEKAHVATVPGDAFGTPNCIRISYASDEALLDKALDQIGDALLLLKGQQVEKN